jgi:hypothetical protein
MLTCVRATGRGSVVHHRRWAVQHDHAWMRRRAERKVAEHVQVLGQRERCATKNSGQWLMCVFVEAGRGPSTIHDRATSTEHKWGSYTLAQGLRTVKRWQVRGTQLLRADHGACFNHLGSEAA